MMADMGSQAGCYQVLADKHPAFIHPGYKPGFSPIHILNSVYRNLLHSSL
jgi:hypothetical protein